MSKFTKEGTVPDIAKAIAWDMLAASVAFEFPDIERTLHESLYARDLREKMDAYLGLTLTRLVAGGDNLEGVKDE